MLAVVTILLVIFVISKHVFDFYVDHNDLRRFPAPACAAFTSLWSAYHSRRLRRSRAIYEAHKALGPVVRIQPKHVSFADPRAVQDIYGHKSACEKDAFYDTISGGDVDSIVSTRDRGEHARKRRYISHVFSQKNVTSMEPLVLDKAQKLVQRLDRAAEEGETIDIREWLNFFTFDVISDMAFGNDPNFLQSGEAKIEAWEMERKRSYQINPIQAFQNNTIHVASIGHWPALLSITKYLTKWFPYSKCGDAFSDMCIQQILSRLKKPNIVARPDLPHGDFFQHLLVDSATGQPRGLPFQELVQEAGVFLSAGSDTTASSMTNTLYLLLKTPAALSKLRSEIHSALLGQTTSSPHPDSPTPPIIPYTTTLSPLRYLRACIDESLRHLPPTSIGLLRMTPPQGALIAGHPVRGGITVSVPTYTLHHDPHLFPDPWEYRPERWLDGAAGNDEKAEEGEEEEGGTDHHQQQRQRTKNSNLRDYVIPFTLGRHACLGRNVAYLEQSVVLASLVWRYEFEFAGAGAGAGTAAAEGKERGFELPVLERINANPGAMVVRVRRRRRLL